MKRKLISVAEYNRLKKDSETLASVVETVKTVDDTTTIDNVVENLKNTLPDEEEPEEGEKKDPEGEKKDPEKEEDPKEPEENPELKAANEKIASLEAQVTTLKKLPGADPAGSSGTKKVKEPTAEEDDPLNKMFEGSSMEVLKNLREGGVI